MMLIFILFFVPFRILLSRFYLYLCVCTCVSFFISYGFVLYTSILEIGIFRFFFHFISLRLWFWCNSYRLIANSMATYRILSIILIPTHIEIERKRKIETNVYNFNIVIKGITQHIILSYFLRFFSHLLCSLLSVLCQLN